MTLRIVAVFAFLMAALSLSGCSQSSTASDSTTFQMEGVGKVQGQLLSDSGGRISWYTGAASHRDIAFDATSAWYDLGGGVYDRRTDIYLMDEQGRDRRCITCNNTELNALHQSILEQRRANNDNRPGFFIGQPEWHPDGTHVIVQVENANSPHRSFNFPSFGLDNDLWLINAETGSAQKVLEQVNTGNAFLHPRFSRSGSTLIFSARNNGGAYGNQWDRWYLGVADFDVSATSSELVSNIRFIQPNGRGFYETTGFVAESESVFSYTFTAFDGQQVPPFADDGYITDVNGSFSSNVVHVANIWDEKPRYSPSGNNLVIMSNRFDEAWQPVQGASTLTTELYIGAPEQPLFKLTDFMSLSRYSNRRLLVTDHEWNAQGNALVVLVQPVGGKGNEEAEIWRLDLPQAY